MPALFRCLSLCLILLLTACAATAPSPPPVRTTSAPTRSAPPAKSATGPARTLAVTPAPQARPSDAAILGGDPTLPAAQPTGTGPIVMGTPLPTPKSLAPAPTPLAPAPLPGATSPESVAAAPVPAPAADAAANAVPPTRDPLDPALFPAGAGPTAPGAPALGTPLAANAPTAAAPAAPPIPTAPPAAATTTPMADTPAQGMPASGTPRGVAGIAWGSSAKSVAGLVPHEADPALSVITYTWPSGPHDVVGAPIRDAFFEFHQDRFYHAWIDLDGLAAYQTALAGLIAAYGPPTSENREKYYHAWTLGEVNVYCAFHPAENEGDVSYFYQPIYDRLAAARKAAQSKAGARRSKS